MEGYRRPTLKLEFTDEEYVGLEVRARRLSVGDLLSIVELRSIDLRSADAPQVLQDLADKMAPCLLSWNLQEDDGTPVPTTSAGLISLDQGFFLAVIEAIVEASAGVSRPLPNSSNSGDRSLEELLPMESFSGNPVL